MSEVVDVSVPRQSRHIGAYVEMLISSILGLVAAFVLLAILQALIVR